MDFNQRDENVSFYPHNHLLDPTLTESQKDFLKFEKQKLKTLDDAKALRVEQLQSENEQLKLIIGEMRKEIESIRDKTHSTSAQ